jgi:hypothetical protein
MFLPDGQEGLRRLPKPKDPNRPSDPHVNGHYGICLPQNWWDKAPAGQLAERHACTMRSFGVSSICRPVMYPPNSENVPPGAGLIELA